MPVLAISLFFFFNDTATTEIYTLSLHDALPIWAGEVAERLLARVGGIDGLRSAPWKRLVEAQGEVVLEMTRGGGGLPFEPVVDGVVLPRVPLDTVAAGAASGVRLVTGTTRDDMTPFLIAMAERG